MGHKRPPPKRRALVLGAGGVLGAAWMTGALPAVQEFLPCPIADVDLIVGTSAGSVLAAALRCGVSIEEMIAFQRGEPVGALAGIGPLYGGPWPRPPRLRFGSPRLMASALVNPHRVHPAVGASAWLPIGREHHAGLRAMMQLLDTQAATPHAQRVQRTLARAADPDPLTALPLLAARSPHWIGRGQTWVVAVDYDSGKRVVFGREGAPQASLADAVVASCSVPGWYEPYVIGGRRYVDGGVRSATSLGLLVTERIDEVVVLAPMASVVADRPLAAHKQIERRVRGLLTFALQRDIRTLRAGGARVTLLTPGPRDLAAMGVNLMDPRRQRAVLETSLRTTPDAIAASVAA